MLKNGITVAMLLGIRTGLVTVGLIALVLLTAVACGSGAKAQSEAVTEAVTEAIQVRFDREKISPDTIQVTHGDMVKIMIESIEPGQLHFHGYDIEVDVVPGALAEVSFEARVTGTFKITLHPTEEDSEHEAGHEAGHETEHEPDRQLGTLVVAPR